MNVLHFFVTGYPGYRPVVMIDGQRIKLKKDDKGRLSCAYTTEAKIVRVTVLRYFETNAKGWFWLGLLFLLLGLGMFAPSYSRRCLAPACCFDVWLGEQSEAGVNFVRAKKGGRVVEYRTECGVQEYSNVYNVDLRAKRRARVLALMQALIIIGVLVTGVLLIIKYGLGLF